MCHEQNGVWKQDMRIKKGGGGRAEEQHEDGEEDVWCFNVGEVDQRSVVENGRGRY
jgi:hypothetical protein